MTAKTHSLHTALDDLVCASEDLRDAIRSTPWNIRYAENRLAFGGKLVPRPDAIARQLNDFREEIEAKSTMYLLDKIQTNTDSTTPTLTQLFHALSGINEGVPLTIRTLYLAMSLDISLSYVVDIYMARHGLPWRCRGDNAVSEYGLMKFLYERWGVASPTVEITEEILSSMTSHFSFNKQET